MKQIVELFYESYIRSHLKEHYQHGEELSNATHNLLKSFSDEQRKLFSAYEFAWLEHVDEREKKIIDYIFSLLMSEI